MNQVFCKRLLHLLKERPQQGKRMVGLGADALLKSGLNDFSLTKALLVIITLVGLDVSLSLWKQRSP